MVHASPDPLTTTFAALADPTRRAILSRLATGDASVTELAEPFDISLPAVSRHLKVLERAGLIARSREAQWRRCRIEASPLRDAAAWMDHYRTLWEARLNRLDAYLMELQSKGAPGSGTTSPAAPTTRPRAAAPRSKSRTTRTRRSSSR